MWIRDSTDAVKQYKSMEDTLRNALSVAKGAGDDIKTNAHGQAQVIIKDAEAKAAEIINQAAKEVADINYRYEEMKRSVEVFKACLLYTSLALNTNRK